MLASMQSLVHFFGHHSIFVIQDRTCFRQRKSEFQFCPTSEQNRSIYSDSQLKMHLNLIIITRQIEHNDCQVCVFKIARNQRFESLLSSSIPQLKTYHFTLHCNVFRNEVDSDGGLGNMLITFLVGSNQLRIYRPIIELLPTF